jgi:AmiR/NasT family two-component response regulator
VGPFTQADDSQLRSELESRRLVGVAQGILLGREGMLIEQSWAYLHRVAAAENVTVDVVARRVVAHCNDDAPR